MNDPRATQTAMPISSTMSQALQAMDQGFLWLDEALTVRAYNQAYCVLMGIEPEVRLEGLAYRDVLKFLLEAGEFFDSEDHAAFIHDSLRRLHRGEARRFERVRPDGTVLSVATKPLSDGGFVYTYLDVTRESRALEDVRRNAKATVVAMANFSEHRDADTGAHVLRVARLCGQAARQLQRHGLFTELIDEAYIDLLATASILHDVGKIATPDHILRKNGPLTADERASIQQHAGTGANMLNQAALMMTDGRYMRLGAEIALTHHEWYDGGGYPNCLSGDAIPVSGRICALADVFDALTSRRPYKEPWSAEQALALIQQQAGSQFDPLIAQHFIAMIREREKVSLVQWTPAMSVGNLHIDEQHQILIDTINQLASAESQSDRPLVAMIIDELIHYATFHFEFEEQLMSASGYPGFEAHRRVHDSFVTWIKELREEFTYYRRRQLGDRMLTYLRDWLREHILGEDQRYRPFIRHPS